MEDKVKFIKTDLKRFCEENLGDYLCHENIDNTCLGKGRLHPNIKGNPT